jgi:hypothetical protein
VGDRHSEPAGASCHPHGTARHPHRNSLAAVAAFTAHTQVLVVPASERPGDVVSGIRAGPCAYVTKNTSLELLRPAIYTAAGDGFWLSAQLADMLNSELADEAESGAGKSPERASDLAPLAPGRPRRTGRSRIRRAPSCVRYQALVRERCRHTEGGALQYGGVGHSETTGAAAPSSASSLAECRRSL